MVIKMMFSMLRLNEFLSYSGEIVTYLKSMDKEGLQINSAVDGLDLKYEKALEIANRNRSSEYTNWLEEKDHRRDESFVAFRNLIEANTHRKPEVIIEAADRLCRTVRSHGWSLQSASRAVQSAKMASLIKELNLPVNTSLIDTLDAGEWYKDMVDDHADYLQLQEAKTVAEASEIDYDTMAVYKDLQIACQQLFEGIEVLNRLSPNEKYTNMENFINDCSQRYMTAARSRKTKNVNLKEETEEQEA